MIAAQRLDVEVGDVTPANVGQLRTLNLSTLPVRYSDKFYKDLINSGNQDYMKFAYWNGFAVAGVCARLEPIESDQGANRLYIMTINVLPAYRRRGIATTLLRYVLDQARKETSPPITYVYLHVQTSNLEAKAFYISHGFVETGIIEGYYKRIEPPDCFVLQLKLDKNDTKE